MLKGTLTCRVSRFVRTDMKGKAIYAAARPERCSIVNSRLTEQSTSVRADTSASQGRATLQSASFRLLMSARTNAVYGSKLTIDSIPGQEFRVTEVQPRFDTTGKLDHYQIDLGKA